MLRQAENTIRIEGIVSEIDLKEDVSKTSGRAQIMGEIKVRVTEEINGKPCELEIPISLWASQLTNDGRPNAAYKDILDIKNNCVSIAACGDIDRADRIRFETASISVNEFYGSTGNLISTPRIRGSFSKRVRKEDCIPSASFSAVIVVAVIKEEVDRDENLTGNLIITGVLPQYGGKVDVLDFYVESKAAINHIQSHWKKGDTVRIAGKCHFTSETKIKETQMGFGDPVISSRTVSVRRFVVTAGSDGGLDGDLAYDKGEISAALNERQKHLTELKENSQKKTKSAATGAPNDFGF